MCTLRPVQFHSRISWRKSNECSNQVLWKEDKWKQPQPIHHSVPSSREDQMQQIQRIEIFSWKGVILSSFGSCLLCYVQMKIPMHHNSRDFSVDFYSWSSAECSYHLAIKKQICVIIREGGGGGYSTPLASFGNTTTRSFILLILSIFSNTGIHFFFLFSILALKPILISLQHLR